MNSGFFHLRTPEDLVLKLRREFDRLSANPADSDAAFNFFVTAIHVPEWCQRSGRQVAAPADARDVALLAVCAHLGNGAKHFAVNRHDAIQHNDAVHEGYGSATYGSSHYGQTERLVITLSIDEASALGKTETTAIELASEVLAYWWHRLGPGFVYRSSDA